jgi:hypothetical protein
MRLEAYYYEFKPTGVKEIDRILCAVSCAGKAYHNTEDWNEKTFPYDSVLRGETPIEWIQNAANDAAMKLKKDWERADYDELREYQMKVSAY